MQRIRTNRMRSKYGNKRCKLDGYSFDSVKEMNRYADLKFMLLAGEISDLELQKPFVLQEGFKGRDGKWVREIRYIADFYYFDKAKGEWVIEDVKSAATADNSVYKLKKKMMAYKGLYITEV